MRVFRTLGKILGATSPSVVVLREQDVPELAREVGAIDEVWLVIFGPIVENVSHQRSVHETCCARDAAATNNCAKVRHRRRRWRRLVAEVTATSNLWGTP